jgi:hypothetical protein
MSYEYAMHTPETPHSSATTSTSPLKELRNNLSKVFGLGEVDSKASSSQDGDLMTTSKLESDQMVDVLADYIDDTPPCVPGPSGASRVTPTTSRTTATDERPTLRRFPSFTELKSWSTKDPEIDYEGMELNYLPDNSPLRGKEKAEWVKKKIDPTEQLRRSERNFWRYMNRRQMQEARRLDMEWRTSYAVGPGDWFHSREEEFDSKRELFFGISPSLKLRDYYK